MTIRKYLTEFGLHMRASNIYIVQQDTLEILNELEISDENEKFQINPCHIYMITRQPRIILDTESSKIEGQFIKGRLKIQQKDTYKYIGFEYPIPSDSYDLSIYCHYPYTEIILKDDQGTERVRFTSKKILADMMKTTQYSANSNTREFLELISFEVLYIGQSFGREGSRTALDRLLKHETLQKIYSKSINQSPDQEIWLFLLNFEQTKIITIDPLQEYYGTSLDENNRHLEKAFLEEISEEQKINFTEAALIRYFQPEYNKIYKINFPSSEHKTYSECYELDINTISFEIETQRTGCIIKSTQVPPKWVHSAEFPLHSSEERKSMLDLKILEKQDNELSNP